MVLIRGLDRLPNTAQENLSDADWEVHTRFLQSEFEAEGRRREAAGLAPTSFEEFAAPFADRPFNRELHKQVLALREQAESERIWSLARICRRICHPTISTFALQLF